MNLGRGIVGESLAEQSVGLYWAILGFLTWLVFDYFILFYFILFFETQLIAVENGTFWDAGWLRGSSSHCGMASWALASLVQLGPAACSNPMSKLCAVQSV